MSSRPKVEVVVVDSASTDETPDVLAAITKRHPQVRAVCAQRAGSSEARNLGAACAAGSVLAFLDDDVLPGPQWLDAIEQGFERPEVGCVGGRVEVRWPVMRPQWLPEKYSYFLGAKHYGDRTRLLQPGEYPAGANIAFRRSDLVHLRGFSPELGHHGDVLGANEEVYLCDRLRRLGRQILYTPEAVVEHLVAREHVSERYFLKRARVQGVANARLDRMLSRRSMARRGIASIVAIPAVFAATHVLGALGYEATAFGLSCEFEKARGYLKELFGPGG